MPKTEGNYIMSHFVMPEDKWIKLCKKQCKERQKEYGPDPDYCDEYNGICPECAHDAAKQVPNKYRITAEVAESYTKLPGL